MNAPSVRDGMVVMPKEEFEELLAHVAERGAKRAMADVGLDGPQAADDVRELRSLLSALRQARSTAWQTAVRIVTTSLIAALVAGIAWKLRLFGSGQ